MKKLISLLCYVAVIFSVFAVNNIITVNATTQTETEEFSKTPRQFLSDINIGWNLGNTFDCFKKGATVANHETSWGNPVTTKEMIDYVANTGFNAVRVPVSWGPQVTESNGKYTVKPEFIARVKEVVNFCLEDNGMYVIVNMHHDDNIDMAAQGTWLNLSVSDSEWQIVKEKYRQIWQQVAEAFKGYGEKLILEGGNEILSTQAYCGCGTSTTTKCWWGHSQKVFDRQNELYQIFVDTVRASGGNNDKRYLMLPTYGAQWYENQVENLLIPNNDPHIIMDIHWYETTNQINESKRRSFANMWIKYANQNSIGVVIGECGFNENSNADTKVTWADNFVKDLKTNYNIPVFLWDDGGNMRILERKANPISWSSNSRSFINTVIAVTRPDENTGDDDKDDDIDKIPYGDANGDGVFNASDVSFFKRYLYKFAPNGSTKFLKVNELADVNFDGKYDVKDMLLMRKYFAGLITSFT